MAKTPGDHWSLGMWVIFGCFHLHNGKIKGNYFPVSTQWYKSRIRSSHTCLNGQTRETHNTHSSICLLPRCNYHQAYLDSGIIASYFCTNASMITRPSSRFYWDPMRKLTKRPIWRKKKKNLVVLLLSKRILRQIKPECPQNSCYVDLPARV